MTLGRLNAHFELLDDYLEATEIARRLRESAGLQAQNLSGMPHGGGAGDLIGNTVVEIVRLEEQSAALKKRVVEDQKEISEWIDTISDIYVQEILRLRYLHGLKWQQVADCIGGGNTAQSCSAAVYRLFD